jgi:hypothetical protein
MKKIGTLGYIILGLITTSAFAQSTPAETIVAAPESAQTSATAKHKKGGKKHAHHKAHKKHKKDAAEQK